jgi:hypothetical protein
MNTYNPGKLSADISCTTMSYLSYNEAKKQGEIMNKIFRSNEYDSYTDGFRDKETSLIKGSMIDKKNCIYKRPEYNMGDWGDQFSSFGSFMDERKLFNNNTKAKTITKAPSNLCKDELLQNDVYNLGTNNVFTNQFSKF